MMEDEGKYEIYQTYLPALFLEQSTKLSKSRIEQREREAVRKGLVKMENTLKSLKLDE